MMRDPLTNYAWNNLYKDYDKSCQGYDPESKYLEYFKIKPLNDRDCYYAISEELFKIDFLRNGLPIKLYIAILYWKLNSSQYDNVLEEIYKINNKVKDKTKLEKNLKDYISTLNIKETNKPSEIVNHIKNFNNYPIYGAQTSNAFPVRTTLLHFLYPNVIPIFDKMVLQAVGINEPNANHDIKILKEYLSFALRLTNKYQEKVTNFKRDNSAKESPLRIIDMALWINRGK